MSQHLRFHSGSLMEPFARSPCEKQKAVAGLRNRRRPLYTGMIRNPRSNLPASSQESVIGLTNREARCAKVTGGCQFGSLLNSTYPGATESFEACTGVPAVERLPPETSPARSAGSLSMATKFPMPTRAGCRSGDARRPRQRKQHPQCYRCCSVQT